MFDIEKYELDLWEAEYKKSDAAVVKQQIVIDNDPAEVVMKCNEEFARLLNENQGEARHTKAFNNQVQILAKREKLAKKRMNEFNLVAELDKLNQLRLKHDMIARHYNMIKYQYNFKRRDN